MSLSLFENAAKRRKVEKSAAATSQMMYLARDSDLMQNNGDREFICEKCWEKEHLNYYHVLHYRAEPCCEECIKNFCSICRSQNKKKHDSIVPFLLGHKADCFLINTRIMVTTSFPGEFLDYGEIPDIIVNNYYKLATQRM